MRGRETEQNPGHSANLYKHGWFGQARLVGHWQSDESAWLRQSALYATDVREQQEGMDDETFFGK